MAVPEQETMEKCCISSFSWEKEGAGDPTGSRAELLSHRALVESPRGSSGVEQLPKAAGVTESERMQILY